MNRSEIESEVKQAFGIFPGWMSSMPDPVLDQYWAVTKWVTSDSSLNARDKALVAFGAASALHCEYWVPFHTAQLGLAGLNDEQVKDAAWTVQSVAGASAYIYGTQYDKSRFREELQMAVAHIKKNS